MPQAQKAQNIMGTLREAMLMLVMLIVMLTLMPNIADPCHYFN